MKKWSRDWQKETRWDKIDFDIFPQAPVTEAEAEEMAKKIGAKGYFETSAKENLGVAEVFAQAAKLAWLEDGSDSSPGPFDCCVIV